jgi:hypothetical protein
MRNGAACRSLRVKAGLVATTPDEGRNCERTYGVDALSQRDERGRCPCCLSGARDKHAGGLSACNKSDRPAVGRRGADAWHLGQSVRLHDGCVWCKRWSTNRREWRARGLGNFRRSRCRGRCGASGRSRQSNAPELLRQGDRLDYAESRQGAAIRSAREECPHNAGGASAGEHGGRNVTG